MEALLQEASLAEKPSLLLSPGVKQVWAIGGGKGGVGKSLISSSLALTLARQGKSVTAIDFDLGGANLHTALGIEHPKQTLNDFIAHRVQDLRNCVLETEYHNLSIISGAQDSVNVTNLSLENRVRLLQSIWQLPSEYVIIDLGAGTTESTVDFFNSAHVGIIVLLPEPTSIENAYRFIKSCYYRKLYLNPKLESVRDLIVAAMDGKNTFGIRTPAELLRAITSRDPKLHDPFIECVESFKFKIVMNQARTQADADMGASVKTICKKYFGINMDYLGNIDYDSRVWQAVRRKRPTLIEFPNSQLVNSIERMIEQLIRI